MARPINMDSLPQPLAITMWAWVDVVETATLGMGDEVRMVAINTCTSLRKRVVMTPPLETVMEDARNASATLAAELDRKGRTPSWARAEALDTLSALIAWLHGAKPNESTKELGLGW